MLALPLSDLPLLPLRGQFMTWPFSRSLGSEPPATFPFSTLSLILLQVRVLLGPSWTHLSFSLSPPEP